MTGMNRTMLRARRTLALAMAVCMTLNKVEQRGTYRVKDTGQVTAPSLHQLKSVPDLDFETRETKSLPVKIARKAL
jgi:hypothetical protein